MPQPKLILVVGASGATGRLVIKQLLDRGHRVRAIVRSLDSLPDALKEDPKLSVIQANLLELSDAELAEHLKDCESIVSCLGHNLTFKGIFGAPRRLVTDATCRLCTGLIAKGQESPARFVLMNTAGNSNRDLDEPVSFAQKIILLLLRLLVPPHRDNELAADYLRTVIGPNHRTLEWVVVRPDALINEDQNSEYESHASPTSSAIFNPGKTSRLNVAHFMAGLLTEDRLWEQWKGQMPVIYNKQ